MRVDIVPLMNAVTGMTAIKTIEVSVVMVDSTMANIPAANVGVIGIIRDER